MTMPRPKVSKIAAAVRIALLSGSPWLAAHAATLPVPCVAGACGAGITGFVGAGAASWAQAGSKLTINQTSTNAILNWASFNISSDGTVQFVQPSTSSVALNEIYDSNPSQIFGALDANGHVFLINQNGIIFGSGAQVNVGGLIASTLNIASSAVTVNGGTATLSLLTPGQTGQPAFSAVKDANGNVLNGNITVQQGATIDAADGGQIYMFAPNVTNLGTIQTPDGQTILAAGNAVYLTQSQTSDLRGMLVEVEGSGMVTNGLASNGNVSSPQQLVGQVIAEHGNISLAALAVNQYGRVSANTSVTENGSIYLQARNGDLSGAGQLERGTGGTLVLGQNSDTEVTLDTSDPSATVDSVAQPKSTIEMSGAAIQMLQGSVARATSGVIDVYAAQNLSALSQNPNLSSSLQDQSDGSRFYMAPGSVLDVSGANITLPASDNVISAQLEATELADSPIQRNGPLHGQTIYFDTRAHGTNSDGSIWWGTPVADVTGEIQAITRNVVERNLTGGTVNIQSQGDVVLAPGSKIDISGGYIQYTGGYIDTSDLLTLWGQTVPVASANPNIPYAGVVNSTTTTDTKWGVTQTYQTTPSYYSPGYIEGKDAGTLELAAPAFIADGTVSASTVVGPYQTQPTTAEPATAAGWATSAWIQGSLYRPYDEVPQGATLVIGLPGLGVNGSRVVDNVTTAPGEVLAGLTNADGTPFNPLADPLPSNFTASVLQPDLLNDFDDIRIYADGKVVEPAGTALSLQAGGSFTAEGSDVDIEGAIDAPGGDISITAGPTGTEVSSVTAALTLGAGASLTATGEWINDSAALYPNGNPSPLYINGGMISLTTAGASASMRLDTGSVIDVTGGAQLTSSGALKAGTGGQITIDAGTPAGVLAYTTSGLLPPELEIGATLRGYGLYEGGTLSVSAAGVCIAAADCSGGSSSVIWLTPQFFNSGGFSSYSIAADQSGLNIAPMTLQLVQQNLELPARYTMLPDAASLEGIATVTQLPAQVRQPINLNLTLAYPATQDNVDIGYGLDTAGLPSLTLPAGTVISTDPGGSLSLSSDTRMDVEGELLAPGGSISLTLANAFTKADFYANAPEYDPTQAIWLGSTAVLDASGVSQVFPDSVGRLTGSVLGGGNVTLDAQGGYLELLPGSLIDVSGTSAMVDITPVGGGLTRAAQIASAGGVIDLSAAEGVVIDGTLEAGAGTAGSGANQPAGGTFSLTLDQSTRQKVPNAVGFPQGSSEIIVSPTLTPAVVAPGSAVPPGLAELGLVAADALGQAGFSTIELKSSGAEIDFAGGVTLSASQEISLDAATYSVDSGTTARVEAPYVEFGNSYFSLLGTPPPAATPGTGVLDVSGGFIELYGAVSTQNIGTVSFDSSGDLRLRGLQPPASPSDPTGAIIEGGLYADGTVDLTAQQIYPTTLTQFVISADPQFTSPSNGATAVTEPASGSIVIQGSEGANQDLLSAGGSITLSAASITQDGVLRAPLGAITFYANTLALGAGSLTSTSAQGATIPFGTTQGGIDWIYPLQYGLEALYGTSGLAPPSQNIALNGTSINVQTGAVIDISGGGDLQAYEWIPGTGGTTDILGASNAFAIIPSLHANVAPYDPSFSAGSSLQPGESVYLSGGSGVPAGTYLLLPARYALLPGAYLVTPTSGTTYRDMQPGQTFQASNGGTIVAGYLTTMGLQYASSRWNGFEVTPSSIYMNEAQYNLTSGNQFFSNQEAQAATASAANEAAAGIAVSAMRLPEDAGVLDLIADSSLTLDGTLRTSAQSGARGAEVDISNPDIVVAADSSGISQSGALVLTASSLQQLGAQTLLLGGEDNEGTITTTAQNLTVVDGASLSAPQILLTAQNEISIQSGASIIAKGSTPAGAAFSLTGDGAFLDVTAGPQISVTRSGAAGVEGTLDLAAGSTLSAGQGSIYLDATSGISTQGSIEASGGNLAVQAPQIALGNAPSGFQGAVLGQNVFGSGSLNNVLLILSNTQAPQTPVEVYSGASVTASNITMDASGLASNLTAGQTVTLSASGTLTLGDSLSAAAIDASSGSATPSPGGGSGSLVMSGSTVTLGDNLTDTATTAPQQVGIDGFGSVALNAQNVLSLARDITLSTDTDLSVTASHITTSAGVTASLEAGYVDANGLPHPQGSVSLLSPASPSALQSTPALGGSLTVMGSSIEVGTNLDMPSGDVSLQAEGSGGITLEPDASIDVAGVVQSYGTASVATPGGNVSLVSPGGINLGTGSSIDVSAGSGGNGGSLSISAPTGTVVADGTLTGNGQGAAFSIDAQSFDLASFTNLEQFVGFSGSQSYRLRGGGSAGNDLTLASGITLTASDVMMEADQGSVAIDGNINASGSSGGNVTLAAADGIALGGAIDAHATQAGGQGGTVEFDLGTGSGAQITFAPGSVINVSGGGASQSAAGPGATATFAGTGGTVLLRVPYVSSQPLANIVNQASASSPGLTVQGASSSVIEAYDQVVSQTGDLDVTQIDPGSAWSSAAQNIVTTGAQPVAQLNSTLGTASGAGFMLEPGLEIDATGSITLDAAWNLESWRYSNPVTGQSVPGILTLRAGGDIIINDSLSDGLVVNRNSTDTLNQQPSWSYRIVAGADSSAANPLAVMTGAAQAPGNVTIGNARVNTGTGFIEVAASGDFTLQNPDSVLYTTGVDDGTAPPTSGRPCRGCQTMPDYASGGGNISIDVGGNIEGSAQMDQFVNDWLWRQGESNPTAWSVQVADFQQGVGALGGGNVAVHAGGDIVDFSASIPSIGVPTGATVDEADGGNLTVSAGGSILGGGYYAGLGTAAISAGGSVGLDNGDGPSRPPLSPLIGLGDAFLSIAARGNLQVSGIVNPTLLDSGISQSQDEAVFATFGPTTSATLLSIGGTVTLDNETSAIGDRYDASFNGKIGPTGAGQASDGAPIALDILPPIVNLYAASGDVDIGGTLSRAITLLPSSEGSLQILAQQNVNLNGPDTGLTVPDVDPATLPSVADPQSSGNAPSSGQTLLATMSDSLSEHAPTPIYDGVSSFDENPVVVVALEGDVTFANSSGSGLWSAKPVIVSAGQDVVDLNLVAQNLSPGDVTSVAAGGNIIYPESRRPYGPDQPNTGGIEVAGPGELQVTAGQNVDLGTSNGITTIGNAQNTALPSTGAGISVEAGISDEAPQYAAFIKQYVDGGSDFDSQLVSYVEQITGQSGLTGDEAKQEFDAMPAQDQRTFVEQLFFTLLKTYGEEAVKSGNNADYAGAYAAIQQLFPGANPDLTKGETDPYSGNISLYFSQIYSDAGGNISLLAPGGEVDAGLALAPVEYNIDKSPEQLGIVAANTGNVDSFTYSDFLVNQSRVFAADGGNMLIWSTEGNIDAGRGSKTSLSAASPEINYDTNGFPNITYFPPTAGSGIQALADTPGVSPGTVDLFAPHGVVNASEAGIVAGNLIVGAIRVLGTNNISVSGTEIGVPVQVTGLGTQALAASSSASGATSAAQASVAQTNQQQEKQAPQATAALRWLDVFVLGFGEETCGASDLECLKRQKHTQH